MNKVFGELITSNTFAEDTKNPNPITDADSVMMDPKAIVNEVPVQAYRFMRERALEFATAYRPRKDDSTIDEFLEDASRIYTFILEGPVAAGVNPIYSSEEEL